VYALAHHEAEDSLATGRVEDLFQQLVSAYYGLIDVDQHIKGRDSLRCFALILKMGKCIMIEVVMVVSTIMAAVSVGSIVVTLFLVAIDKI
jgi:hypothetical protein